MAAALEAVPCAPFRLALAGAGTFGGGRVLWVGVGEGAEPLSALAGQVAAACGVVEDRPYRPHLTVRRGRGLAPGPLADYAGPGFAVERYTLVESRAGQHRTLLTRS